MNHGILAALIAGIVLLLLGMILALYFLISSENEDSSNRGNGNGGGGTKPVTSVPGAPQKVEMKYKRPMF